MPHGLVLSHKILNHLHWFVLVAGLQRVLVLDSSLYICASSINYVYFATFGYLTPPPEDTI